VDREMEGNRISGEFPTRVIDSSAPANDTPVISAYNSVYYSRWSRRRSARSPDRQRLVSEFPSICPNPWIWPYSPSSDATLHYF